MWRSFVETSNIAAIITVCIEIPYNCITVLIFSNVFFHIYISQTGLNSVMDHNLHKCGEHVDCNDSHNLFVSHEIYAFRSNILSTLFY